MYHLVLTVLSVWLRDPVQYQLPETRGARDESFHGLRGAGTPSAICPTSSMPPSSMPQESKVATSKASKPTGMTQRAAALKASYPDMKGIPDRITKKAKLKMVEQYKAKIVADDQTKKASLAPTGLVTTNAKGAKGRNRASALRKQYPDMPGIPKTIGKKKRTSLIANYEKQKNNKVAVRGGPTQRQNTHLAQLPQRPLPAPQQSQQSEYPIRQRTANHDKNPNFSSIQGPQRRPVSNKMAPLSNERRAEVARNLSGGSNDDPINLD